MTDPIESIPLEVTFEPKRRPRPLVGPILWVFGVLLWAYLVLGEFTTNYAPWASPKVPLSGEAAVIWLLLLTLGAWLRAVQASLYIPMSERWGKALRAAVIGAAALALWFWTVFLAAKLGGANRGNSDGVVTLGLLALAISAVVLGQTLARSPRPPQPLQLGIARVALWFVSVAMTLLAVAQL